MPRDVLTAGGRPNSTSEDLSERLAALVDLPRGELIAQWKELHGGSPPSSIRRNFLVRALAYTLQERALGGLTTSERKTLAALAEGKEDIGHSTIKSGTRLYREWQGVTHEVVVSAEGYCWQGCCYNTLSQVARSITGTRWSGPRFFGVKR